MTEGQQRQLEFQPWSEPSRQLCASVSNLLVRINKMWSLYTVESYSALEGHSDTRHGVDEPGGHDAQ